MDKRLRNSCVGIVVFGTWGIILFVSILFWSIRPKKIKKEVLMTGYASGSIIDYRIVIFPDSTYWKLEPNKLGKEEGSYWFTDNDTIKLVSQDKVCATLYDGKYVQHYCDEFKGLSIMHFKVFNPPKEIEFYH